MKINVRLSVKIIILVSVLVVSLVTLISIASITLIEGEIVDRIGENCLNTGFIVSENQEIIDLLALKDPNGEIQVIVERTRQKLSSVEYIVVCDLDSIRYSHPNPEKLGLPGVGEDWGRVAEEGLAYVSQNIGSLGEAVRAFVPIFKEDQQIGYVVVGMLLDDIEKVQNKYQAVIYGLTVISILLGISGAVFLSRNIKKAIFGLEPYEIARLYTEKRSMLNVIREGIIAIDNEAKITMVNESAISILKLYQWKTNDLIGRSIDEVFPENKLSQTLVTKEVEINKQENMSGAVIVANRLPIVDGDMIIGAIATFTDKTQFMKLAEELTGIKQLTDGLRAKNHEFQNKLHIILGLVNRKKYSELKDYVIDIANIQDDLSLNLSKKINNSKLEALLIGKFSRAKELGITIRLFEDTSIEYSSQRVDLALITIVGNLIENAFDALLEKDHDNKEILVGIIDELDEIEIIVNDNGMGIEESSIKEIFDRGYSTKGKNRGTGLSLVKDEVDQLGGTVDVTSKEGEGTYIHVVIGKELSDD